MSMPIMKAATVECAPDGSIISPLVYPLDVTPKYDGIRGYVNADGVLMSWKNRPIANAYTQALFGQKRLAGLDGELVVGEPSAADVYNKTSSGVMKKSGEPLVRFWVFDYNGPGCEQMTLAQRRATIRRILAPCRLIYVELVQSSIAEDEVDLMRKESLLVHLGYEGVMLRAPALPYKFGRATLRAPALLKLKRFADFEAVITGCYERLHNTNAATTSATGYTKRSSAKAGKVGTGLLGGFHARAINGPFKGKDIDVPRGTLTDDECEIIWRLRRKSILGDTIVVKHFPIGAKDLPRFPTFKAFRPTGA
jgi:DNA ligase 1